LAAATLDNRELAQSAAIRETMLKVELMLANHAHAVEEMMEKPAEETTEPAPDVSAAILESTQMTAQAIQQMMQALVMPRTTELQMDEMGNPVGSISRVVNDVA
jgi:beta-lactamase class A